MKSLLYLAGGSILLWAILLGPGWLIQGEPVLLQSLTALGLCLVPALASLMWIQSTGKQSEMQIVAVLGGSGVRLAASLGGAIALYQYFPIEFPASFLLWVGILYMGVLAMEILLVLRIKPPAEQREIASSMAAK